MPVHTLPVVELKLSKVQVDIYNHDTIFSYNSVKKLTHNFVESTKRNDSLFYSWFELLINFS
jgi:hypothetical protein